MIRIGPAGLGPVSRAEKTLKEYSKLGIKACEIAFTHSIYIKKKEDAIRIGKIAKKLGVGLSIHSPYYINLNSEEKEKIEASKKRILDCCKIANYLGAKCVVFHPGYYGKRTKEEAFENIKRAIVDMKNICKKNSWKVELCVETMGKKNVFGSIEEISKLVKETKIRPCIDFAHILARYGEYKFREVFELFKKEKKLHIHFSGIVYGEKGEKYHTITKPREWRLLFKNLPKKEITIINESPAPVADAIEGMRILEKLNK